MTTALSIGGYASLFGVVWLSLGRWDPSRAAVRAAAKMENEAIERARLWKADR